jgi:hypothetical protein
MGIAQAMGTHVVCCAPSRDEDLAARLGVERAGDKVAIAHKMM